MTALSWKVYQKIRLLAFKLQAQLMALLPPKLAHELKNNRCMNIHGGNVPGDLALEFMNTRAKDALAGLHGNLTPTAIQGCNTIVDGYTKGLEQLLGW
jgi:hypothetical protein